MDGKRLPNKQERAAIEAMKRYGLNPIIEPFNCPWDVTCNGKRVELKAASFTKNFWRFNVHRHGRMNESPVDFYVFRLEAAPAILLGKAAIHLVLPAPLETPTVAISPRSLLTRYAKYFNRFDLISEGYSGT